MTSFFTVSVGKKMDKFYPHASAWVCGKCTKPWAVSRMLREDINASIESSRRIYMQLLRLFWRRTDFENSSSRYDSAGLPSICTKYPESLTRPPAAGCIYPGKAMLFLLGTPLLPRWPAAIAHASYAWFTIGTVASASGSRRAASFIQLIRIRDGFLRAWWNRCMLARTSSRRSKRTFTNKEVGLRIGMIWKLNINQWAAERTARGKR